VAEASSIPDFVITGTFPETVSIVLKTPYNFELLVLGSKPFHRNDVTFSNLR
jgi:hypothetical protein